MKMNYEEKVIEEFKEWEKSIDVDAKPGLFDRMAKKVQNKINSIIPEKFHEVVTTAVKNVTQITLKGSEFLTKSVDVSGLSLEEKEELIKKKIESYKKIAAAEGAGTGAGGIMLSAADFPLLLSIKMKMLFEIANLYGFDSKEYDERLYILHTFQLAFSGDERKSEIYKTMKNWEVEKANLSVMDWRVFQQEYRDYLDLAKLLQMVPGIGAAVGAYANYNLVNELAETAMNAYRMRIIEELK
jgi:uncharacterized protein (DUF697 family)